MCESAWIVVLTNDLDFGAMLAATGRMKPSVAQIRAADLRPTVLSSKVVAALRQLSVELELGALVTIDTARTRVRILPFSNGAGG